MENPPKVGERKPRAPASKISSLYLGWGYITARRFTRGIYMVEPYASAQAFWRRASAPLQQKLAFIKCKWIWITTQHMLHDYWTKPTKHSEKTPQIKSETSSSMTLLFQSLYLQQVQLQLVECKKKVIVFVDGFGQVKKNWWCRSSGKLAMDKGKQPSFACRLMLSVSGSLHFSVQRQNCLPNRLFFLTSANLHLSLPLGLDNDRLLLLLLLLQVCNRSWEKSRSIAVPPTVQNLLFSMQFHSNVMLMWFQKWNSKCKIFR